MSLLVVACVAIGNLECQLRVELFYNTKSPAAAYFTEYNILGFCLCSTSWFRT